MASDDNRLPTHWRQCFYVIRPLCDAHDESDRPLTDKRFKKILEEYLDERDPPWDVLRGARGTFKEPHRDEADHGLALSTMNVRTYVDGEADLRLAELPLRFPTHGAQDRIAAVLICDKEGFDDLLEAERVPERYDLALLSTEAFRRAPLATWLRSSTCPPSPSTTSTRMAW